jgi:phage-related protein
MKALRFVGTAREDLIAFPASVRRRAGHELFLVQVGRDPADFKPMPRVGPGVCEIRLRDATGAFRVIYLARRTTAVYVLHAFRKKTQKTAPADIELAAQRYRMIGEEP